MKFKLLIFLFIVSAASFADSNYVRVEGLKNICLRLEVRKINLKLYDNDPLTDLPNVFTDVALRRSNGECGSFEMIFREDIVLLDRFLDEVLPLIKSKKPVNDKEREALRCLRISQDFDFMKFNAENGKAVQFNTSCGLVQVVKREEDGGFYFFRYYKRPYPELDN